MRRHNVAKNKQAVKGVARKLRFRGGLRGGYGGLQRLLVGRGVNNHAADISKGGLRGTLGTQAKLFVGLRTRECGKDLPRAIRADGSPRRVRNRERSSELLVAHSGTARV